MAPKLHFERVYYYWRQSMFGHVHQLCSQFLKHEGNDTLFIIWDALAYAAEGRTQLGLNAIEKIKGRLANTLEIDVAALYIHKTAKIPDYAAITQLESNIESARASSNASSIVSAARILWLTGDNEQALSFVHPLTTQAPANKEAAALLGWIKLTEADRNSGRYFDLANADASSVSQNVDPFVIYGKAMYFSSVSRWPDATSLLAQLTMIADFPEVQLELCRFYIASNSWNLAMEAAQEGQGRYVSDADMYFLQTLYDLSQIGNLESARRNVQTLVDIVAKVEGENAVYVTQITNVIYALCWKDQSILRSLVKLFPPLLDSNRDNAKFLQAYGQVLIALGKPSEAVDILQSAIIADSDMAKAYENLVEAQIMMKNYDEATMQLSFLKMRATSEDDLPLPAVTLENRMQRDTGLPTNIDLLIKAMRNHVERAGQLFIPQSARMNPEKKMPSDSYVEQVLSIDLPEFADAMTESMQYCNTLERTVGEPHNGEICDLIIRMCELIPGSVPFSYYLAILGFGEGRYAQVTKAIQFVLDSKWGFNSSQCYLLLAQIKLQMKQFDEAETALNRAVAFDFSVRSSLRYNMIIAQLSDARGQFDKAESAVNDLMKSAEYAKATSQERINVIIFLTHVYKKMNQFKKAIDTIDSNISKFDSPEQKGQLLLSKADVFAKSDSIPEALKILEGFDEKSPLYSKARKKAAKIYLVNLKDKALYIKCFRELCDSSPTKTNYTLLGDALMKVKRFDQAVECYKEAAEQDPTDSSTALHLARSYMIIHRYDDAIDEYERAATVSGNNQEIELEEVKALIKLRYYEQAKELASDTMQDIVIDSDDWEAQYIFAQLSELIAIIEIRTGGDAAEDYLSEALSVYSRLTEKNRPDIPSDSAKEIREKAADLYQKKAEAIIDSGKPLDDAEEFLKKAGELNESSNKAMVTLARLYSDSGRQDDAKEVCTSILRKTADCEEAAMILADIAASENIHDLEETFNNSPHFFHTLVRLIEMSARQGLLENVPKYFEKADMTQPGAIFSNGLYNYYIGDPMKALQLFHSIRNDPEWGINAQIYSFHIYSNPARKFMWCQEKPIATNKELEAARKILKKLQANEVDTTMLEATLLLAQNTQESVQKALDIYNKLDSDDISVILGKCRCYMRLGQQKQVTRHINSIINTEQSVANYASAVEAYLIMTQISIQDGSMDEADKWIQKAVALDKSCVKAWEMMAQIAEKKKEHASAATALENAWKLTSKNDANIGCKLAMCLMKSQNPVEAIKVAHEVLQKHPNIPNLKEQILIPCCRMIRQ